MLTNLTGRRWLALGLLLPLAAVSCGRAPEPAAVAAPADTAPVATPVYNTSTGRLEQILSDRDGDGRNETRAIMDGARLVRIEIDRNGDEKPDRWEYYGVTGDPPQPLIERAEESDAADGRVTRRETYINGVLDRVEEDTTLDGQPDKWEVYQRGRLAHVDLDLAGQGKATRRLIYAADGVLEAMASDPDGDGVFEPDMPQGSVR